MGELARDTFDTFDTPVFPCIALIVSGGHTDLLLMKAHGDFKWLGGTRDDAAGEAFDKIGRLLKLPYPGGPTIEKAAEKGNSKSFERQTRGPYESQRNLCISPTARLHRPAF